MKPDFSGYATKAGLRCTDGRTIMPDAFKQQDSHRVPLVWQHGHSDPTNVLGHCILENRPDGVYTFGFFNDSEKAQVTKGLVEHGDINSLSIWANQLIEKAGRVIHGAIREVSLVLAGANPGALIDNVTIRHSDGSEDTTLDDEFIITTGLTLEHADADDEEEGETVEDVYNSLTDKQKDVVHYMIGQALESAGSMAQSVDESASAEEIYEGMTEKQKSVIHSMIQDAVTEAQKAANAENNASHGDTNKEGNNMTRNVFENTGDGSSSNVLSHDALKDIVATAVKNKASLKDTFQDYALAHGITDIETLFPDAKTLGDVPEWNKRRTEWVANFLGATRKSPFSRVKTMTADLTYPEARAKGYIKGSMKKEEFFGVASRVTTPKTVYKKQKLDRDDIIDITDFDVVAWLKGEMRIMLDEEIARAALISDGRPVDHEDKIDETHIRPISKDHELYTVTVNVNVGDANSSMNEVTDAIIMHRHLYKGTGSPNAYVSEYWIGRFLTQRDNDGRRMYKTLEEVAAELRVREIVPVEVLSEEPTIVCIIVNPIDYVFGADRGGQVAMFDDFDIDYNQHKYLIETRVSGALVKIKSAMVIRSTTSTNVLVVPAAPSFDEEEGEVTITDTTGVVYKNGAGTTINAAGSPYAVTPGVPYVVNATPASGYYFGSSEGDSWSFTQEA